MSWRNCRTKVSSEFSHNTFLGLNPSGALFYILPGGKTHSYWYWILTSCAVASCKALARSNWSSIMVKVSSKGKESLDLLLVIILSSLANNLIIFTCQKQAHEETGFPGLVLAVTDTTGNIYEGSAGLRVHKDPSSGPISANDFFWICSLTKLIASVLFLHFIGHGRSCSWTVCIIDCSSSANRARQD